MKHLIYYLLFFLPVASVAQSGFFTDIQNHTIYVDSLAGKKVLLMILPQQADTAAINQLLRFQQRHGDSVQTIGLVCVAACNTSANTFQTIYAQLLSAGIVITEGSTSNTPATEREAMIKWFSDQNRNDRQTNARLVGRKIFLSKTGKKYAELGADISLDSRIARNIAKTTVPGEN